MDFLRMADSLDIWVVCFMAAALGYVCALMRSRWAALPLATLGPIAISCLWFSLRTLSELPSVDSIRPWDLIATTLWSAYAIPTSLVVLIAVRLIRAKKMHHAR